MRHFTKFLMVSILLLTVARSGISQMVTCSQTLVVDLVLPPGQCELVIDENTLAAFAPTIADYICPAGGMQAGMQTTFSIALSGSGSYGIGEHDFTWLVTDNCISPDGSFTNSSCGIQVNVNTSSSFVIACNNTIQASLDDSCRVVVTADMILEGTYDCYNNFDISIEGVETDTIFAPGTYTVTVTEPSGTNSCWGTIVVEDKLPPVLFCEDITVECSNDIAPGTPINISRTILADTVFIGGVAQGDSLSNSIPDPMTGASNATAADSTVCLIFDPAITGSGTSIISFELELEIEHENINELEAYVINPTGSDTIRLFTRPLDGSVSDPSCTRENMIATFSDNAVNDYALLDAPGTCRLLSTPSILGMEFKPEQAFSTFNGDTAGVIKVLIVDTNPFSNRGKVILGETKMRMVLSSDTIPYPSAGTYVEDPSLINGYTVSGNGVCGVVSAFYTEKVVDECVGAIFTEIERTWTVSDASGNTSSCTQVINVLGTDLDNDIDFPHNYDGIDRPHFNCDDIFEMDEEGNPHPNVTGRPMSLKSMDGAFCGNIQMTYNDTRIDVCPTSYKLVRTWLILDWCTNDQPVRHDQIIKVLDERPPITTCSIVDCFEVPIEDPYVCSTSFDVPAPIVLNECGGYTWSIKYLHSNDVPGYDFDPYSDEECPQPPQPAESLFTIVNVTRTHEETEPIRIDDLELGVVWIRYVVIDDCGNESPSGAGACEIRIVDRTKPVAVCDQHTVVAMGVTCEAEVLAKTFDDLSWDNCSDIVLYEARRLDNPCNITGATSFGPSVRFCKADINKTVFVELKVYDRAGNYNICKSEVYVQDKFVPVFTYIPPDATINCEFTQSDLDATAGTPTATDNCPNCFTIEEDFGTPSVDQCGEGSLIRRWNLFDNNQLDGNGEPLKVDSRSQRVTIIDTNPFTMRPQDWPNDETGLIGCELDLDPSVTGEPNLSEDDACSLVATSYDDLIFDFVDGACKKVLREWTVLDWCTYDEETGVGIWKHTQVIKVNNVEAPELLNGGSKQFCGYNANCTGDIELDLEASDDCTPLDELIWNYYIDYDSDGVIDVSRTNEMVDSTLSLSGNYPVGNHTVTVVLEDGCGNESEPESFSLTISDCKEPTPICISSVTVVVMPSNGSVEIWASDFNLKSEDNCTPPSGLRYSFSSNANDANKTLTCADLSNGIRSVLELQMWVHDEAGNSDFCTVQLDLQDNGTGEGVCADTITGSAIISGIIQTEQNEKVNNVDVQVMSAQPEFPIMNRTTQSGDYSFNSLLTGYNYQVTSSKDDDHINGVSTLDLVLIQKHILGLTLLDSPYKVIAADADNNQYVSAIDLVWLRKLILGQVEEFPNGQNSWRFLDDSEALVPGQNPFPYDELINVNGLSDDKYDMDFMAVKIGDVNLSANPINFNERNPEVRSSQALEFAITEQLVQTGDIVSLDVTANNFDEIAGFQFTFNYNPALQFIGYSKASLEIGENNVGTANMDRGMITMSWNDIESLTFDKDEVLFTLEFKANADTKISEAVSISSRLTNAEAYTSDLSIVNTKLVVEDKGTVTEAINFELYQNSPNPFGKITVIGFDLPTASKAVITVHDVTGKLVTRISDSYAKGYNEITLDNDELGMSGVMYYTLESDGFTATKKMVGVK